MLNMYDGSIIFLTTSDKNKKRATFYGNFPVKNVDNLIILHIILLIF